jgi:hypothetical protein
MAASTAKAFTLSALLSLFFSVLWVLAVWQAGTRHKDWLVVIFLGSYPLVVGMSVLAALCIFKARRWQAACGSLAVSSTFICVVAALVAWHHHITTGP